MPEQKDILGVVNDKLTEIIATLERIERRQIRTTEMVETTKEATPVVGSFGSINHGSESPEKK